MYWVMIGASFLVYGLMGYYTSFWRSRLYLPLAFLVGFSVSFAPGNPFLIDNLAARIGLGVVYGVLNLRASKTLVESLYKKLP